LPGAAPGAGVCAEQPIQITKSNIQARRTIIRNSHLNRLIISRRDDADGQRRSAEDPLAVWNQRTEKPEKGIDSSPRFRNEKSFP
jgi:hypothetical protein